MITKVEYIERQKYPFLLVVDDKLGELLLAYEQRYFNYGEYLFIGSKFQNVVPEIEVKVNDKSPEKIQGFIHDPDLSRIYLEWKKVCESNEYELGEKPWPQE